jgi:DNA (cytosine-5)-methyltransferase 1
LIKYNLVNFCEFDKYAAQSFCAIHNVDENKNLGDITKVNEKEIADFNMMVGGSPCQDFSVAGKQEGAKWTCKDCGHEYNPLEAHYTKRDKCPKCELTNIEKTRSSLLAEWLRILREKKPNLAIYENVKNIVGKQFKATFDLFETELKEYGYNTYWKVLNAKDYGIPQNRERVYLIIIKKELDNGLFQFPKAFNNGLRLIDFLESVVDERYYISQDKTDKLIEQLKDKNSLMLDMCQAKREGKPREYTEISPTLSARDYKEPRLINSGVIQVGNIVNTGNWDNPQRGRIYSSDGCSPALNCCGGGGLEPKILQTVCEQRTDEGLRFFKGDIIGTLRTIDSCGDKRVIESPRPELVGGIGEINFGKQYRQGNRVYSADKTAMCLLSQPVGNAGGNSYLYNIDYRIRKLIPKECFRLMGFSDSDFEAVKNIGISDSQCYKQAGNSIVVDVLYYILLELYKTMPYLLEDIKLSSFFSGIGAFEKAIFRLMAKINNNHEELEIVINL